jgi:hypothetical protein
MKYFHRAFNHLGIAFGAFHLDLLNCTRYYYWRYPLGDTRDILACRLATRKAAKNPAPSEAAFYKKSIHYTKRTSE